MDRSTNTQDRCDAKRIAAGQTDPFAQLYRQFFPLVHRIGLRILGSSRETDDFEQDVFLAVYRHIADFNGTGPLHAWIGRIACNTALNRRLRRIEPTVPPDMLERLVADAARNGPEQQCIIRETVAAIHRAIHELPRLYRDVAHLAWECHLTYPEISRISGVPVGTIKAQIHRARAILHHTLRQIGP
jgi:RNA polymerase sigma-70 factor (ECF subfamily)